MAQPGSKVYELLKWLKLRNMTTSSVDKNSTQQELSFIAGKNSTATVENSLEVSYSLIYHLTQESLYLVLTQEKGRPMSIERHISKTVRVYS
jgi:hypothetical protein